METRRTPLANGAETGRKRKTRTRARRTGPPSPPPPRFPFRIHAQSDDEPSGGLLPASVTSGSIDPPPRFSSLAFSSSARPLAPPVPRRVLDHEPRGIDAKRDRAASSFWTGGALFGEFGIRADLALGRFFHRVVHGSRGESALSSGSAVLLRSELLLF